jgi:hypothetical protein
LSFKQEAELAKKKITGESPSAERKARVRRPFPRATLEEALKIPYAIKDHNGGNPWAPEEVRKAVGASAGNSWFYLTAASRDYGLTTGTRDTEKIALADLGRDIDQGEGWLMSRRALRMARSHFTQFAQHQCGGHGERFWGCPSRDDTKKIKCTQARLNND